MADTLIIAKEIIVGSEAGQHGRLSPSSIVFFGAGGTQVRMGIWATNEGTTLSLRDGNNRERIRLEVSDEGAPELSLADGNGQDKITARINEDGDPHISLRDTEDTARLSLCLLEGDLPSLAFFDRDGALLRHWLGREGEGRPQQPCACSADDCAHETASL